MAGLGAVVLAAGHARRFGDNKLLQPFRGAPLLLHAIAAASAAPVDRIVIVKRQGADLDQLCQTAASQDSRIVSIEIESQALSESLRAGLDALADAAGVYIFLGDMPLVPHHVALDLAEKLAGHFAVVPTFQGAPGHPVLLSLRAAALACQLSGDQGAGALLRRHAGEVAFLEIPDEGVVFDVDTPDDIARLSERGEGA